MANPEHVEWLLNNDAEAINKWRSENPDKRLDFSGAHIDQSTTKIELASGEDGFFLSTFYNLDLSYSIFDRATLKWPTFSKCNLDNTSFKNTIFDSCSFRKCSLKEIDFKATKHLSIDAVRSDFSKSSFQNKNIHSIFEECIFQNANLNNTSFDFSNLSKCDFSNANLEGATFYRAEMNGVILLGANIKNANFAYSKLLSQEQIDLAHGNDETVLLSRMKRPKHWSEEEKETKKVQIPAPIHFVEAAKKVDVDTPSNPDQEYSDDYKKSVFGAFQVHVKDFSIHIAECNVSNDTIKRAKLLSDTLAIPFDEYNAVLIGGKFRSFANLVKIQWDAISDGLQFDFKELEKNHLALEDMYSEARDYRRNSARASLPDEGIPIELEEIIRETLQSKNARKLLSKAAQDKLSEVGEEAVSNDPATLKERAMGILTTYTNLSRVLENIVAKGSSLAESANQILVNSQKVLEWISTILDKF